MPERLVVSPKVYLKMIPANGSKIKSWALNASIDKKIKMVNLNDVNHYEMFLIPEGAKQVAEIIYGAKS